MSAAALGEIVMVPVLYANRGRFLQQAFRAQLMMAVASWILHAAIFALSLYLTV